MALAVLVAGFVGFGLYWFAPWNLFVDKRVDEALPAVGPETAAPAGGVEAAGGDESSADPAGGEQSSADASGGAPPDGAPAEDVPGRLTLASGGFRGLEHATDGIALIVELAGGSRYLRLEDLETSNGPDLRVVLTDQPLSNDWRVWDDGELVDLGPLKGNIGSSNYEIPADVDLSGFRTAVVWCRRFSVGFGVAPLEPPGA